MKQEILKLLKNDARLTPAKISKILGGDAETIENDIKKMENEGVIAGYTTMINWEKTQNETVTAIIEVKVSPQRISGFDRIAERIYKFNEVKACYLMSGGFDLTVIVEGKTMKEVALFVAEKLAPMDYVNSTATHFVLKRYKDNDIIFEKDETDDREVIII